ncbi:uncharacterized protein [Anoplolepis gracilipes]|uniref:uncharacterized protein isoform X3 n=1 Tax=Anoplolepis gracilipes TaxID=354296 RepID=UPI003B9F38AF
MKSCFLCGETENVKTFSNDILNKCIRMIKYRKIKGFKYADVPFSVDSMDDFGYHLGCYKKITCLKSRYKKEFDNMLERGEFDNMSEQGEFDNMSEQNIQLSTSQSQTEEETSRCAEVCASIPGASSSTWDSLHQVEKTLDVGSFISPSRFIQVLVN